MRIHPSRALLCGTVFPCFAIAACGEVSDPPGNQDAGAEDAGDCKLDADGDGYCFEGADCDDADPDAHPGAEEPCDGVDQDCDDVADDGCPFYFGRPSPVVEVHVDEGWHYVPRLSHDGLRLYFAAGGPSRPFVAERTSVDARFDTPVPVAGDDLSDYVISSFSPSPDELEAFVGAYPVAGPSEGDVYRTTRDSFEDAWQPLELLDVSETDATDLHPFPASNGRELYFYSNRDGPASVYRAVRADAQAAFEAPTKVDLGSGGGADWDPFQTDDSRTIFFTRSNATLLESVLMTATRSGEGAPFDAPSEITPLNLETYQTAQPFVSEETGEIFFASRRPWSPTSWAIWRAQVCRDGPCEEPEVDCPSPSVASPDQRHCYTASGFPAPWDPAEDACEASGGHLATLHSAEEAALASKLAGGAFWTGGNDTASECNQTLPGCSFVWQTGEPFVYSPWAGGNPDDVGGNEDCLMADVGWVDLPCDSPVVYVCENEVWPWW